jgi:hypothetical protein
MSYKPRPKVQNLVSEINELYTSGYGGACRIAGKLGITANRANYFITKLRLEPRYHPGAPIGNNNNKKRKVL